MPVSQMAITVELANTISKSNPTVASVTHTPPPVTTVAHPDYTIKVTGRNTTATQSFLTNNNRSNH